MNKSLLIIMLALCGLSLSLTAQISEDHSKNAIYGNVSIFGLGGLVNLNYERVVFRSNGLFKEYGIRIGAGYYSEWGGTGSHALLNFYGLTGHKNNHLEVLIGGLVLYDIASYDIEINNAQALNESPPKKSDFTSFFPAITAGYRYQKPTGGFLFRAGLSYPEGGYVGLGLGF